MTGEEYYMGNNPIKHASIEVSGEYTEVDGEVFYKIENYDAMRPFFMTIVSGTDHWMFISSNGGLTAGRKNSNSALFPYYTDDKIVDNADITGSKTILRVEKDHKNYLWEPFSVRNVGLYVINRNIYKNRIGNKVLFEEVNSDLEISFSYMWAFADDYGFIKKSKLRNLSESPVNIDVLDGIQNIVPYGVNEDLQAIRSTLVDAYKKAELEEGCGMGIYSLSAMIVDKAEPSEALKATTVFSLGLKPKLHLLSSTQLNRFRYGNELANEVDVRAERGAYFINATTNIEASASIEWFIISDINQSIADLEATKKLIAQENIGLEKIVSDIEKSSIALSEKIALADGFQKTNNQLVTGRHLSNVLFNIMRGGVFDDQYEINKNDFKTYLTSLSPSTYQNQSSFIDDLPETLEYKNLLIEVSKKDDLDLLRLAYEYLPLSFSRRHGDPSRPWNKFNIRAQDEKGKDIKAYEGNWRDIFQNWEALSLSFPEYIEGMITKFVNASTIDGYNPYRISNDGIDWEIIEPDDPWSYIGYWGDHQIIYLLKLLELSNKFNPGKLEEFLVQEQFVYANVPYRIKAYSKIIDNPSDTIDYDETVAREITTREEQYGADGKLVFASDQLVRANFLEKLLVTCLTKLYNFIPGAGIWLNTQRPEWNDANNALVGNGASMVTLYQLRRFVLFFQQLVEGSDKSEFEVNNAIVKLLQTSKLILEKHHSGLVSSFNNKQRRLLVDELGLAGEAYREFVYKQDKIENREVLTKAELLSFFDLTLQYIDHTIKLNKRDDGLYHAYNLVQFSDDQISIDYLYEMLEGQVAILGAGYLSPEDALMVLDSLKSSKLFRADQYSYLLYPDRQLARFVDRNTIPNAFIESSELAAQLKEKQDTSVFEIDVNGNYHFNGNYRNAGDLKAALKTLSRNEALQKLVGKEYQSWLDVFEEVFQHRFFTGRSGTFYGYEGLGSIYWHMVSKLLLATQENILRSIESNASDEVIGKLIGHYYEIRAGIGINKNPALYGAFPTDPYSHTPGNAGVQQPGMTGQVKEDILNRWAELGVVITEGKISFQPIFLQKTELLLEDSTFSFYNVNNNKIAIDLKGGSLAFTYCQVPIVYKIGEAKAIRVIRADGAISDFAESTLTGEISNEIFLRSGKVKQVECTLLANSFI